MKIITYTLLPIIFMLHEFEEIIFLKYWLKKDKDYLHKKFPKIGSRIYSQFSKLTTSGFALAIAEEFVIVSLLTYVSIITQNFYIWFTVFMGFSIHIIVHIIQWVLYRKYIPANCYQYFSIAVLCIWIYCIFG